MYSLYGLTLHCELPLPALLIAGHSGNADVRVHCGATPRLHGVDADLSAWSHFSQEGEAGAPFGPWQSPSGRLLRLFYKDETEFFLDTEGREVWVRWQPPLEWPDVVTYLVGPVLGFVLRLHGRISLHASSVVINGSALALAGQAGAGKSTTAAEFALRGHQVLADDITTLAVTDQSCLALPGYPRLCLWPDSVEALLGSRDALPSISGTWEKRYMPLDEDSGRFHAAPVPLRAIYVLHARTHDERAPYLEPLDGSSGFLGLLANTYGNRRQSSAMRAAEFATLERIARFIPMMRMHPHSDISRTAQLCELIENDVAGLTAE